MMKRRRLYLGNALIWFVNRKQSQMVEMVVEITITIEN